MEKIWFQDLTGLITAENYYVFLPTTEMNIIEQLNSLMRFSIYFAILMLIIKKDINIMFIPIIMGVFSFMLFNVEEKNKQSDRKTLEKLEMQEDPVTKRLCQKPTANNPFMNVLVSDYSQNPKRPPACKHIGVVKTEMKKNFERNLYRDIDDVFDKIASDRQFYTTPSTTIPNDSVGYAKWLYGQQKSCKEGNQRQCYANIHKSLNV